MRSLRYFASFCLATACVLARAQQRPAITGVAFERVYSTDSAAAKAFYSTTLGYTQLEHDGMLIYPVNDAQWIEVIPHAPPQPGSMQAAVGLTTRDAKAMAAYLTARHVAIAEPLHDGAFAIRDPEGTLLVFVQSAVAGDKAHAGAIAKLVATTPPAANAPSHRIIHAGFVVRKLAEEDAFYREVLGFHLYWTGGPTMDAGGKPAWQSMQVPDGSDWVEFMLLPDHPSPNASALGGANHIALGVPQVQPLLAQLQRNGCGRGPCTTPSVGMDGKIQLNLRDPDQTRIEYMEFKPTLKPCCHAIEGVAPDERENR